MCSFVIKLTLSQILLILPKFTHFIFITINTHLSIRTRHLPQNIQILLKLTPVLWRDLSVSPHTGCEDTLFYFNVWIY
jgi:hypothetical protein